MDILTKCPLFSGMDDLTRASALFILSAHKATYQKGQLLRKMGDKSSAFGLVLSGTVQACCDDIDGNMMIMAGVSAGNMFGEALCYLKVSESPVYIRALTDCSVLWMSVDGMTEGKDPLARDLFKRFASILAERMLSMNDRIQILSKITLREKLITFFTQCEREYGSRAFSIPFDRESLAIYLGVNRSALSRELSVMKNEGIIDFHKNYFKIL